MIDQSAMEVDASGTPLHINHMGEVSWRKVAVVGKVMRIIFDNIM